MTTIAHYKSSVNNFVILLLFVQFSISVPTVLYIMLYFSWLLNNIVHSLLKLQFSIYAFIFIFET